MMHRLDARTLGQTGMGVKLGITLIKLLKRRDRQFGSAAGRA
jgi:hypothetical protein